jgi:hypothetical protein
LTFLQLCRRSFRLFGNLPLDILCFCLAKGLFGLLLSSLLLLGYGLLSVRFFLRSRLLPLSRQSSRLLFFVRSNPLSFKWLFHPPQHPANIFVRSMIAIEIAGASGR